MAGSIISVPLRSSEAYNFRDVANIAQRDVPAPSRTFDSHLTDFFFLFSQQTRTVARVWTPHFRSSPFFSQRSRHSGRSIAFFHRPNFNSLQLLRCDKHARARARVILFLESSEWMHKRRPERYLVRHNFAAVKNTYPRDLRCHLLLGARGRPFRQAVKARPVFSLRFPRTIPRKFRLLLKQQSVRSNISSDRLKRARTRRDVFTCRKTGVKRHDARHVSALKTRICAV